MLRRNNIGEERALEVLAGGSLLHWDTLVEKKERKQRPLGSGFFLGSFILEEPGEEAKGRKKIEKEKEERRLWVFRAQKRKSIRRRENSQEEVKRRGENLDSRKKRSTRLQVLRGRKKRKKKEKSGLQTDTVHEEWGLRLEIGYCREFICPKARLDLTLTHLVETDERR
ncbi:hypothetical protein VNO77_33899 [Canavalia gladiata]|uniref:Uncharacterized protein n=1 Tax=Canavalia gladiata TaxID=3824 RepID=A0AAN9KCQ1_CANGL